MPDLLDICNGDSRALPSPCAGWRVGFGHHHQGLHFTLWPNYWRHAARPRPLTATTLPTTTNQRTVWGGREMEAKEAEEKTVVCGSVSDKLCVSQCVSLCVWFVIVCCIFQSYVSLTIAIYSTHLCQRPSLIPACRPSPISFTDPHWYFTDPH